MKSDGWEWTSSAFAPLPGFHPMPDYPEYSADFFDGKHFTLRGASASTPRSVVRDSFRNFYQGAPLPLPFQAHVCMPQQFACVLASQPLDLQVHV